MSCFLAIQLITITGLLFVIYPGVVLCLLHWRDFNSGNIGSDRIGSDPPNMLKDFVIIETPSNANPVVLWIIASLPSSSLLFFPVLSSPVLSCHILSYAILSYPILSTWECLSTTFRKFHDYLHLCFWVNLKTAPTQYVTLFWLWNPVWQFWSQVFVHFGMNILVRCNLIFLRILLMVWFSKVYQHS